MSGIELSFSDLKSWLIGLDLVINDDVSIKRILKFNRKHFPIFCRCGGQVLEPLGGQFLEVLDGDLKIAIVTSILCLLYSQLKNEPNRPSSLGCKGGGVLAILPSPHLLYKLCVYSVMIMCLI